MRKGMFYFYYRYARFYAGFFYNATKEQALCQA